MTLQMILLLFIGVNKSIGTFKVQIKPELEEWIMYVCTWQKHKQT